MAAIRARAQRPRLVRELPRTSSQGVIGGENSPWLLVLVVLGVLATVFLLGYGRIHVNRHLARNNLHTPILKYTAPPAEGLAAETSGLKINAVDSTASSLNVASEGGGAGESPGDIETASGETVVEPVSEETGSGSASQEQILASEVDADVSSTGADLAGEVDDGGAPELVNSGKNEEEDGGVEEVVKQDEDGGQLAEGGEEEGIAADVNTGAALEGAEEEEEQQQEPAAEAEVGEAGGGEALQENEEQEPEEVQGTEEEAQGTEDEVQGTEEEAQGTEDEVQSTEEEVQGAEEEVQGTEEEVQGTEEEVQGTEEELEEEVQGTEEEVQGTENDVQGTEEEVQGTEAETEEEVQGTEEEAQGTEEEAQGTEEEVQGTEEEVKVPEEEAEGTEEEAQGTEEVSAAAEVDAVNTGEGEDEEQGEGQTHTEEEEEEVEEEVPVKAAPIRVKSVIATKSAQSKTAVTRPRKVAKEEESVEREEGEEGEEVGETEGETEVETEEQEAEVETGGEDLGNEEAGAAEEEAEEGEEVEEEGGAQRRRMLSLPLHKWLLGSLSLGRGSEQTQQQQRQQKSLSINQEEGGEGGGVRSHLDPLPVSLEIQGEADDAASPPPPVHNTHHQFKQDEDGDYKRRRRARRLLMDNADSLVHWLLPKHRVRPGQQASKEASARMMEKEDDYGEVGEGEEDKFQGEILDDSPLDDLVRRRRMRTLLADMKWLLSARHKEVLGSEQEELFPYDDNEDLTGYGDDYGEMDEGEVYIYEEDPIDRLPPVGDEDDAEEDIAGTRRLLADMKWLLSSRTKFEIFPEATEEEENDKELEFPVDDYGEVDDYGMVERAAIMGAEVLDDSPMDELDEEDGTVGARKLLQARGRADIGDEGSAVSRRRDRRLLEDSLQHWMMGKSRHHDIFSQDDLVDDDVMVDEEDEYGEIDMGPEMFTDGVTEDEEAAEEAVGEVAETSLENALLADDSAEVEEEIEEETTAETAEDEISAEESMVRRRRKLLRMSLEKWLLGGSKGKEEDDEDEVIRGVGAVAEDFEIRPVTADDFDLGDEKEMPRMNYPPLAPLIPSPPLMNDLLQGDKLTEFRWRLVAAKQRDPTEILRV